MKLGVCLTGGGAKGAFQGGIIKRFKENNIKTSILTGTSIGAVNGYLLMKGAVRELEEFWTEIEINALEVKIGRTIDNTNLIDELSKIQGENDNIEKYFVNYVKVEEGKLYEIVKDIRFINKEDALDAIRFSSLIPTRPMDYQDLKDGKFNSSEVFQHFKEDVIQGIYEGYRLDGGILNNNLLSPFIENRVDRIIIVALRDDYEVPDYIYNYYNKDSVFVLKPDIKIQPGDTLRFEREFCRDLFERGYKIANEFIGKVSLN